MTTTTRRPLPRPYGLTDDELTAYQGDVAAALDARYVDARAAAVRAAETLPAFDWLTASKFWGQPWAESKLAAGEILPRDVRGPFFVVAGLGGSTAGVIVADGFTTDDAARAFAVDFEAGRVFATREAGAAQWFAMVELANRARRFEAGHIERLRARARAAGVTADGREISRAALLDNYNAGRRFRSWGGE